MHILYENANFIHRARCFRKNGSAYGKTMEQPSPESKSQQATPMSLLPFCEGKSMLAPKPLWIENSPSSTSAFSPSSLGFPRANQDPSLVRVKFAGIHEYFTQSITGAVKANLGGI